MSSDSVNTVDKSEYLAVVEGYTEALYSLKKTQLALKHAIRCFKTRAMSMTTDQLVTEVEDILSGQAVPGGAGGVKYYYMKESNDE